MDELEELVTDWLSLPEVADALQSGPSKVRQWIRERQLIAVRVGGDLRVPAECLQHGKIVKGLGGTLTVLSDVGFSDVEANVWMFTADESLPGRPIDALRENRGREVRRRAQALAF